MKFIQLVEVKLQFELANKLIENIVEQFIGMIYRQFIIRSIDIVYSRQLQEQYYVSNIT